MATLNAENAPVRNELLAKWFESAESSRRLQPGIDVGLRASGELNPVVRKQISNLASTLAPSIVAAMEQETDPSSLSWLSSSLSAMAARMEPTEVARLAHRLLGAMEQETNLGRLSTLGYALPGLAARLQTETQQVWLLGLSCFLIDPPPSLYNAKLVPVLLEPLTKQELTEVLKWPFCVGRAEEMVLLELEQRLTEEFQRPITFGGDLGELIRQAKSLGIENLHTPAQRPTLEAARQELNALLQLLQSTQAKSLPTP